MADQIPNWISPELLDLHLPRLHTELAGPSPLSTLLTSAALLAILTATYAAGRALIHAVAPSDSRKGRGFQNVVELVQKLDRNLVWYGSWLVGTHYYSATHRTLGTLFFFGGAAITGALLPWPWCLWAITLGMFGVFIVYRHWSHNENAVEYDIRSLPERINIDTSNLNLELITAGICVFLYAPVAFAQMQVEGIGFVVPNNAPRYTFVLYSAVELLKIVPIIQYYDVFADKLHFDRFAEVVHPSLQGKVALVAFRGTVDLIVLAALKRFADIAQRVAAGLDMRPLEEALKVGDEGLRKDAVRKLRVFAEQGRQHAKELLTDILKEKGRTQLPADLVFSAHVRFAAAAALGIVGDLRRDEDALWLAVEQYEILAENEWNRDSSEVRWAVIQEKLGDALFSIGKLEPPILDRLRKATQAYGRAIAVYRHDPSLRHELHQAENSLSKTNKLIEMRRQEQHSDQSSESPVVTDPETVTS